MPTNLFNQIVYGPVHSRRLGLSLGINLSPPDGKRCTFNCIYCECGLNEERKACHPSPSREDVRQALSGKLAQMNVEGIVPDRITFSGNGEPTMHPAFSSIITDTLEIRNRFCPSAKIAVLTNSTLLHKADVVSALCRADENLMKLDAATDELIRLIDQPVKNDFTAAKLVEQLCSFNGKLIIQSIFLSGEYRGVRIDNTGDAAIDAWLAALQKIRPQKVMIYTIDRETPVKSLQKIPLTALEEIAAQVRNRYIKVDVFS